MSARNTDTKRSVAAPDALTLTAGLETIFGVGYDGARRVTVVSRECNDYQTTHGSEVVTCRLSGNEQIKLLCKYQTLTTQETRGLVYEGLVYRDILNKLDITVPTFYGTYRPDRSDQFWLVIGYLDHAEQLHYALQPNAVQLAARWIGHFHRLTENPGNSNSAGFLRTYDHDRYLSIVQSAVERAASTGHAAPWLDTLCRHWEAIADQLSATQPSVIHGDYFQHNILLQSGRVYPVDWELAAIGIGEIDLATLTMGWDQQVAAECEREYTLARWRGQPPSEYYYTLQVARMFAYFHWIAASARQFRTGAIRWALQELQALAKETKLIH
jgi:thiamine kinase-like enzyme